MVYGSVIVFGSVVTLGRLQEMALCNFQAEMMIEVVCILHYLRSIIRSHRIGPFLRQRGLRHDVEERGE